VIATIINQNEKLLLALGWIVGWNLTVEATRIIIKMMGWSDDRGTFGVEESPHFNERDAG